RTADGKPRPACASRGPRVSARWASTAGHRCRILPPASSGWGSSGSVSAQPSPDGSPASATVRSPTWVPSACGADQPPVPNRATGPVPRPTIPALPDAHSVSPTVVTALNIPNGALGLRPAASRHVLPCRVAEYG